MNEQTHFGQLLGNSKPEHAPIEQKTIISGMFSFKYNQNTNITEVVLIDSGLLIKKVGKAQRTSTLLKFDFNLKLKILKKQDKNSSPAIGFRILKNELQTCSCYTNDEELIKKWIKLLSARINIYGFNDYYKPQQKIGKGAFCVIHEAQRLSDRKRFAVKSFIKKKYFTEEINRESLQNQVKVMRMLQHKNLVALQGVYETDTSIYIAIELLKGGDLFFKIINHPGALSLKDTTKIMRGILQGLKYLQGKNIIHRDLKPENIMFKNLDSLDPVILDFGFATIADESDFNYTICGSVGYVAPEIMNLPEDPTEITLEMRKTIHISPKCDVYSAGLIFHNLLTGEQLLNGDNFCEIYDEKNRLKIDLKGPTYKYLSQPALHLMCRMLTYDPLDRISASDALKHIFFEASN